MSKLINVVLISCFLLISCKAKPELKVSGSETMHYLAERLGSKFDFADLQLTGGGSKQGLIDLLNEKVDIALVSRELSIAELEDLKRGGGFSRTLIAYDGLAIVVNPENKIESIDRETLAKVFSGEISNWLPLTGEDQPINIFVRDQYSGTTKFFIEEVLGRIFNAQAVAQNLGEFFSPGYKIVKNNDELTSEISANKNSIGFMGMGGVLADYAGKVKAIKYSIKPEEAPILPTPRSIDNRSYKLARGLYFVYKNEPSIQAKEFIDFSLKNDAQRIILESGFLGSVLEEIVVREKSLTDRIK